GRGPKKAQQSKPYLKDTYAKRVFRRRKRKTRVERKGPSPCLHRPKLYAEEQPHQRHKPPETCREHHYSQLTHHLMYSEHRRGSIDLFEISSDTIRHKHREEASR
ncbi:unnamed protein product, partial [Brassica oleracea]